MDDGQGYPSAESQSPFLEVQPILDIVHHHDTSAESSQTESLPATETLMVHARDLRNFSGVERWSPPCGVSDDIRVTVRISHRYSQAIEASEHSPRATSTSCEKMPAQNPILASEADSDSDIWSSALFDVDRTAFFNQDTPCNQEGFVELNQFCYFCQHLCNASRALNAYVYEVDDRMPRPEPPNTWERVQPRLPHREIQEYFDFWPSSSKMLASAQNGCHLCTIICQRLIQRLDRYENPEDGLEMVPSYGPVKLVVCWWWSHPHQSASTSDPSWLACVGRALFVGWPSSDTLHGPRHGHCGLLPQSSISLDLRVDATCDKDQIVAELRPAYRSTNIRNRCPTHCSFDCQCARRLRAIQYLSPDLRDGKDHLLSHYTGSDAVLSLAQSWISTCHEDHVCHPGAECETPGLSFRPTRLLDVGDSGGMQFPRLDIKRTDSTPVEYLALSHCWGTNSHDLYKLTRETEQELLRGVKTEKLSRTFQDAIMVCRKLKQRYIWIDTLCIKQDNDDDWACEAAQMHLVYANSYCTIAAVCARGDDEGFLRLRNPRGTLPHLLNSFLCP